MGGDYLFPKEATKLDGNHRPIRLEGFQESLLCGFPKDGSEGDLHIVPCVVLLAVRLTFLKSLGSFLSETIKSSLVMMPASSPSTLRCVLSTPMDLHELENSVRVGETGCAYGMMRNVKDGGSG